MSEFDDPGGHAALRLLVTRLAHFVEAMGDQQQQANTRWEAMAARWDGYIVEQRQFNQRLQSILEHLPPAEVPTEARRRYEPGRHRGSGALRRGEQGRLGATVLISTDLCWDAPPGAFRPYLGTWEQLVFRV
jgi:hypothetical protein